MTQNPWQVNSIQAFVYINCPECSFKTKEEGFFQDHAVASHPMCFPLFGRTDIVIEEVTVEDQKPEYYIEVKAEEVPSELELASALASLEEPIEESIEIFDDTSTHSIVESDTKSVGQSNDSNATQNQADSDKALENMLNNLDDDTPYKIARAKIVKKEKASFAQMLDGLADKTYKCYYCNKVFSKRKFLDLHYKNHLDKNGHFPCQHCSRMFPGYREIKSHIRSIHTPSFCKDCNKSFFSSTSYERHRKSVHVDQSIKNFKCDLCAFETHANRYIITHKQTVHAAKGAALSVSHNHMCKKCNGGFKNKGSLQNHLCNKSKKETEEQMYKCPKCEMVYNHKSFLIHHKRTHGGLPPGYEDVKKYVCDKCSEEFLHRVGLRQHKESQMCIGGSKEICCDKCIPKVSFESPTIFIRHYREIHNGYPPMYEHLPKYLCSHCPRICISEHQLKKHQRFSHSNKKPTIKPIPRQHCAICKKDFSTVSTLKNHMIMMHEKGENSALFQCEICNKRMPTATKLKEHFRDVHTKVTCEICHEVQYNWYYLKRHKASAHGMIPSGYTKCPHCALVFRNNCTLLKHINSKHR